MIFEEARFEHKGYECRVLFADKGYRCGCIKIPKGHPLCVDNYEYITNSVYCYGGLSYVGHCLNGEKCADDVWIGFDCSHASDAIDIDALEKYYPDEFRKHPREYWESFKMECPEATVKTLNFCKYCLRCLVDQLETIKKREGETIWKSSF